MVYSEMVWSLEHFFPGTDAVALSTLNTTVVTKTERFPGENILLSATFSFCPNPC